MLAFFGISYTACQESKADTKDAGSAARIREEITRFDMLLKEMSRIQDENVKAYGEQMGVSSNSNGLELITQQNEVLDKYKSRLEYHRLQLLQADTANNTRNEMQLKEISEDLNNLQADGQIIRDGLTGDPVNTKVTK